MRFVLTRDRDEFAKHARGFLEARIERNVLATVLADVLESVHPPHQCWFAYGLDTNGRTDFAALRTPPWSMLASEIEPPDARRLIECWLDHDPGLPGVSGPSASAHAIAGAWSQTTGRTSRCRMREALQVLEEVRGPSRPASGKLRVAGADERELLASWMGEFGREAGVVGADQAERMVDARLGQRRLFVWDDGGPVSMLGVSSPVAGAVRIGPVYTPPDRRRRGYATSAVAAASRQALERGASRCLLYTDLANPTSNKIYAEVGYRCVADWEDHAFEAAPPA